MQLGLVGANCYILKEGKQALVIDPGGEPERILEYLEGQNLEVDAILLTHAHFDHIGALEEIRRKTGADVYLHPKEADWLGDPMLNGSHKLVGEPITASPADHFLEEGPMDVGLFRFEVIHTPGHSPGSVSFIFPEHVFLFSGDALFQGSIGRTDLTGGDFDELAKSIRTKLYALPEEYTVFSGHGPQTTIGHEKMHNPFVRM